MAKDNKQISVRDEMAEFLLYTAPNGDIKVEVFLHNENIWLTQKRMAELFNVDVATINEHLKNIYNSGELDKNSTIRNFLIVQIEGNREIESSAHNRQLKQAVAAEETTDCFSCLGNKRLSKKVFGIRNDQ